MGELRRGSKAMGGGGKAGLPTVRSNQAAGEMRGNIKERIYMQSRNCVRVWVATKLTCHRRARGVVGGGGGEKKLKTIRINV